MTCDEALAEFLSLDNGQTLPPPLAAHLTGCAGCRGEVEAMQAALAVAAADHPGPAADLTDRVLERVRHLESGHDQRIPFQTWIAAGLFLMFGALALPASCRIIGLHEIFGGSFELALSFALGLFLTIYATAFIGLNLTAVVRWSGFKPEVPSAAHQ